MNKIIQRIQIIILAAGLLIWPVSGFAYAGTVKDTFPKLADYYLRWELPNTDLNDLAKYDVLVLDMEVQHNSLANLKKLRQLNPKIIILAYVNSEQIYTNRQDPVYGKLHGELAQKIDSAWWLRDKSGKMISNWTNTNMMNITDGAGLSPQGERWNDFLPEFVNNEIVSTGLWDGVFYDTIWPSIYGFNNNNIDTNNDGQNESRGATDSAWLAGTEKMLAKTGSLFGGKYLVAGNSRRSPALQPYLNGIMLESFPAPWEADGTWAGSMKSYTDTKYFVSPQVGILNANTDNTWSMTNYRKMRFSLGSALLGNGSFSFDYGVNDHSQTWWYDEYETALGQAVSAPLNILDKNNKNFKSGLWRRDFANGIVIVNSTGGNQNYVFTDESFAKINGTQDPGVNNGAKVNMVSIMGQDAVILLGQGRNPKQSAAAPSVATVAPAAAATVFKGTAFQNGAFYRVFDAAGNQAQNGFFSYDSRYPAGAQILSVDLDNDQNLETLVNSRGLITIYRGATFLRSFKPFADKFKGDVSLAAADLDNDGRKEIVVGAGKGGGPLVRIFNKDGRLLTGGFFAYDRNFRGGVNVAAIDLNGDGTNEIITGAGTGGGPQVRIFNKDGNVLGGFFAYGKNTRSGVTVAAGDVSGPAGKEIITGAGSGLPPQVRIWNKNGKLISEFFAYDKSLPGGILVGAADISGSGQVKILAGSLNY